MRRRPGIRERSSSSCSPRSSRRRAAAACRDPLLRAVTLFGGFTLWSFLSITWADAKGEAWDGANRTLLLFTVYTLFALLPWRPRDAALLLGALATGTAAIGSWVFLADAGSGLSEGRFTDPVGYANANAGALPRRFLAGRSARLPAGNAVARARALARCLGSAPSARCARTEPRFAAGLRARTRALPRAGA